uniref:FBD domain-containing protein n=1 Tax=Oryza glaberrima TaxID=4538 RepID=I1PQC8_ORYGL
MAPGGGGGGRSGFRSGVVRLAAVGRHHEAYPRRRSRGCFAAPHRRRRQVALSPPRVRPATHSGSSVPRHRLGPRPVWRGKEIAEGRTHWTEEELRVFLHSCLEEIQARNIISSSPEAQGYINLERKMLERAGKRVTKKQVKWRWAKSRKNFGMWTWLESKATGLGRDTVSQAILASDEWWEIQESERKGAKAFKDAPLKCIDEHHAVFRGRTVVQDHSNVQPAHQPMINVEDIRAQPPSPAVAAARAKGKRPCASETETSGSSSKSRTCSDSSDEALHRLADDDSRVESMESRAEKKKARGARACMDMVVADGYRPCSDLWLMALALFLDPYWRQFFLDDCATAESRLRFIQKSSELLPIGVSNVASPSVAAVRVRAVRRWPLRIPARTNREWAVPADSRGSLNLTKLSLREVDITDEDLNQFLSECNHLREVDITDCRMLTNLRVPGHLNQLKSLLVAICPLLREIKLSCGVTALDYRGPFIPLQLAIPSQTTNVSISLLTFHSALGYIFSDLPSTLTNLETLTLKSKQVERIDMLSRLPRLISLRHLTLGLTISDLPQRKIDLLDFASLLKAAPFMEKLELHMKMVYVHQRYCQDDGELRSLPRCPHSHLSWVQITGFFGEKDQLELALHILRNATFLKAMVIETSLNTESESVNCYAERLSPDGYSVALEFLGKEDHNNAVHVLEADDE